VSGRTEENHRYLSNDERSISNVQNSYVPKTSQKSCNLSQISGPKFEEANLGFKDLGAKQIRAEKGPAISCQTNELISCCIIKKNFEDVHEIMYSVCDHVTR